MKVNHNEIFKYYQKGIYPDYSRVIAIGDIHGDYDALLTVLIKAKIIDKDVKLHFPVIITKPFAPLSITNLTTIVVLFCCC